MRYIIIGAGAIGGAIGGRLFESGHEVVLVARGAHYTALRENGLRLATPEGVRTLPVPVADRPESVDLGVEDVLVLAVKSQDSAAALDAWADRPVAGAVAGKVTGKVTGAVTGTSRAADLLPLVCAQNGVDNERLTLRRFARVQAMCVWMPATHTEPGVVQAQGSPVSGVLHLGRYPSGIDEDTGRIAADLEKSTFAALVRPDVMRWKYAKLLSNLRNSIEALCGPAEGSQEAAWTELSRLTVAEGKAALAAAGIDIASEAELAESHARLRVVPVAGAERGGGSSWQSLVRGVGSIESDYLNGEIVLLGRLHGVPTPINALLQRRANQFARERREPGSLAAADLLREIEPAK
jgi:2-dehydropantoate 2-reductase